MYLKYLSLRLSVSSLEPGLSSLAVLLGAWAWWSLPPEEPPGMSWSRDPWYPPARHPKSDSWSGGVEWSCADDPAGRAFFPDSRMEKSGFSSEGVKKPGAGIQKLNKITGVVSNEWTRFYNWGFC